MTAPPPELELEEQFYPTNAALFERRFPWIRIVSGFRVAIETRKMLVALLGVIAWSAGDWLISYLPASPRSQMLRQPLIRDVEPLWPWSLGALPSTPATVARVEFREAVEAPWRTLDRALGNSEAVLWPLRRLVDTASGVVRPRRGFTGWLHTWVQLLWALSVAAFFGGAISRMAAVDVARQTGISLRRGMRYSGRRFVSFLGAPLITLAGLGLCWGFNAVAGLVAEVPVLGETIVAVFWILPLILGFFMALIVIGVAAGWPLMIAAVAVDGSDAFDALSRAYSYIFNRPWYALFLSLLSLLYGSILLYFVMGVLTLTVDLTTASVQTGLGNVQKEQLFASSIEHPHLGPWRSGTAVSERPLRPASREIVGVWMSLLASVPVAFVFSYFWTASTILYVLLRRREDGALLDELAPDDAPGPAPLPLVGIPATVQRDSPSSPPDSRN